MIISMIIYNNKRLLLLLWMMNINKHFEHYHYPQSSNILWSFSFFLVTFDDSFNMWKNFFGLFGWVCFIISSEIYIFWFVYKWQTFFLLLVFFCCSGLVEICLLFHQKKNFACQIVCCIRTKHSLSTIPIYKHLHQQKKRSFSKT